MQNSPKRLKCLTTQALLPLDCLTSESSPGTSKMEQRKCTADPVVSQKRIPGVIVGPTKMVSLTSKLGKLDKIVVKN